MSESLFPLRLDGVGFDANGRRLLVEITARLAQVPVTVLLGPNGAGKTLLLRACRGLITPTRGSVRWGDRTSDRLGTRVGHVPQHPVMLRRSVRANIDYALSLAGTPHAARDRAADTTLRDFQLDGLARRGARRLSGGERQRLAIARAWAQRPAALLLDEPAAHLDPAATAAVERSVRTVRDAGTRIILCTHDLHQARRLADTVVYMDHGCILEQAPARTFFDRPATEEARRYLAGELLA